MFATAFYKTICVMLIVAVWHKTLRDKLPQAAKRWGMKAVWVGLVLVLWTSMPRYRIHSGDRVRLVYLEEDGDGFKAKHPPLVQYVLNTLLPEEEIVNVGITAARFKCLPFLSGRLTRELNDDMDAGKAGNFFSPFDNLGWENPMSGVYAQAFNDVLGGDDRRRISSLRSTTTRTRRIRWLCSATATWATGNSTKASGKTSTTASC